MDTGTRQGEDAGMTDRKILPRWSVPETMTMWYDEEMWLPFIETENADIIGPGHQDKEAFAALVNFYDSYASGDLLPGECNADNVAHSWAVVYDYENKGYYFVPCDKDDENAVAVTTIWGVR